MIEYRVTLARAARKELEKLNSILVQRIFPRLEALARCPRPVGCVKLQGASDLWRIRIGDYRVLYRVDDGLGLVDVVAISHRKDAYR